MSDHLRWCIIPADANPWGPLELHIFASFDNQQVALAAAVHMNWTPDRERVRVIDRLMLNTTPRVL